MSTTESSNASSSEISEDEGEIDVETRAKFSEALEKIARRDASIYDKETRFFETPSESSRETSPELDSETKPLFLKDLLEHGADAYASDDLSEMEDVLEEPKSAEEKRKRFLYDDQQKGHRNELLEALEIRSEENEGEFGGLIKVSSPKTTTESDPNVQNSEETIQKCLDSYFSHVSDLNREDAAFLKEYIQNEEWRLDKWGEDEEMEDDIDIDEDEAYLERQAKFESDYNHRFEEPGSHEIVGHPRMVQETVRKRESRRKRQRENKAKRKQEKKVHEEQEIKERKNRKRKEIQKKLEELNKTCGDEMDAEFLEKLLESDQEFDADEWDAKMGNAFNDTYYKKDDAEFSLPAEDADSDSQPDSATFEEEEQKPVQKRKKKRELKRLMEEYYDLDREDTIDDIRCRYRYIKVPKEDYGLRPEDILWLEDKTLNGYVGMAKLNPYRDDLIDFQPKPWKLKKLLSGMDYSTYPSKEPMPSASISPENTNLQKEEMELAEKIRQEMNPNAKARLESYSQEILKPYSMQKATLPDSSNNKPQKEKQTKGAQQKEETQQKHRMSKSQKRNLRRKLRNQEKRKNALNEDHPKDDVSFQS